VIGFDSKANNWFGIIDEFRSLEPSTLFTTIDEVKSVLKKFC